MPLWLGMVPGEKDTQALHMNLLNDIVVKQKTHLSTGILGTWQSCVLLLPLSLWASPSP
jgi:hypothetical protein